MSYQGCSNCKHFNWKKGNCKAFPKGIPLPIKSGEIEHTKRLSGQQGETVYQPRITPDSAGFSEIEIEILPKGTHTSSNGFKLPVSDRDLDDLVTSYDPANFQAPLIISHDTKGLSDKELGHSEFAFGIPKKLKRVGDRVKAVFEKVAPEFEQWVRDRKLVSVSPSFYLPNSPSNPTPGKLSLRHIAALGATPPAIKGMTSLQEAFNFNETTEGVVNFNFQVDPETLEFCGDEWIVSSIMQRLRDFLISEYDLETADRIIPGDQVGILMERRGFDPMFDRLIRLEKEVFGDTPNYQQQQMTTDFSDREHQLAERERLIAERETKLRKAEFTSFCESLKGKLTPAIASIEEVANFMEFLATSESIDFSESKSEAPIEWFKAFLGRLPAQVQFGEMVREPLTEFNAPVAGTFDASEVELDRQIRAYMNQHKVEYAEAMTALGFTY